MADGDDLDALVRRVDPDRWLATRFIADLPARAAVIAVYAFNYELAHVAETVSQPMIGEIRLAWWREGLEALFEGGEARPHPVLRALAGPIAAGALARAELEALLEARHADLDPAPFADEPALVAWIDHTAGAVMALAARALDRGAVPQMTREAARAWGWTGLLRAKGFWEARGEADDTEVAAHVRHRVHEALAAARRDLAALPVAAFPAVAYASLATPYARRPELSDLAKRVRLTAAVLRGRV
jgi:phytoene synthase